MSKFKIYIKSILIPLTIGGIIAFIISDSIDYNTLNKPFLAPPSIVFPIVWTILYILMGISYGILKVHNLVTSKINRIYYSQLFVNALWSIIFFSLKLRFLALLWIILLLVLVAIMIVEFYKQNKIAGLLQIPYLIWVTFATYLTLAVYILNK